MFMHMLWNPRLPDDSICSDVFTNHFFVHARIAAPMYAYMHACMQVAFHEKLLMGSTAGAIGSMAGLPTEVCLTVTGG